MKEYAIDIIRKDNPIYDFLSKKGHQPKYSNKEYHMYNCPFVDHHDSTASFALYTKPGLYQNYYCFGCHRSGCIISLQSELNNLSWYEAFKSLGGEVEENNQAEVAYLISKIKEAKNSVEIEEQAKEMMSIINLQISVAGYEHLEYTNFDNEEKVFLDKLYKKVDKLIESFDLAQLNRLYEIVFEGKELGIEKNVWDFRKEKYIERIEKNYS